MGIVCRFDAPKSPKEVSSAHQLFKSSASCHGGEAIPGAEELCHFQARRAGSADEFVTLRRAQTASEEKRVIIETSRPRWALIAALIAAAFGLVTIAVGGSTLVSILENRDEAGNIVNFVLWFNFLAGFAYVAAAVGLFSWKPWAAPLSAVIAVATVFVFIAFGVHVWLGGAFETRTVGAMTLRSIVWIAIAAVACRALGCSLARTKS